MEIKYCSKCHKEAYRIEKNDGEIKIIQRGETVLNLSESSSASISFTCPSGHPVKMEINKRNRNGNMDAQHNKEVTRREK